MKFFVDTADLSEIYSLAETGLLDGVTTNPTLVAKSGHKNFIDLITQICSIVDGPVSAEVASTEYEQMYDEALRLASIASNVAVKVPLTPAGLKVCKMMRARTINVTLCFSAAQAILAAKAGAGFVSPFVGRLDDVGENGMALIADICEIYKAQNYKTEVLVASVRHPQHVVQAAKLGAHVVTLPPNILRQLFNHPLTDKGLAQFVSDWKLTGQTIL